MIKIIKDRKLILDVFEYDVLLIGMSYQNNMGCGFQYDVRINFPIVDEVNQRTPYCDPRKLGTVVSVKERGLIFCLCYITKGKYRPDLQGDMLDYEALSNCLECINKSYSGMKVASTLIGGAFFDGDGDRDKIIRLIEDKCKDVDFTIYDYQQKRKNEENDERMMELIKLTKNREISYEEYLKRKADFLWERKHGIWNNHLRNQ